MSWERLTRHANGRDATAGAHLTIRPKNDGSRESQTAYIVLGLDVRTKAGIEAGDYVALELGRDEHVGMLAIAAGATKQNGWRISAGGGAKNRDTPSTRLQFVARHLGIENPPEMRQAPMKADVSPGRVVLTLPETLRAMLSRSLPSNEAAKSNEVPEATISDAPPDRKSGSATTKTDTNYAGNYADPSPAPAPPVERMVPRQAPEPKKISGSAWDVCRGLGERIAEELGTTAVRTLIESFGISKLSDLPAAKVPDFAEGARKILKQHELAKKGLVAADGPVPFDPKGNENRLGMSWDPEEDDLVIRMAADDDTDEAIAAAVRRSVHSVQARIRGPLRKRVDEAMRTKQAAADQTVTVIRHGPAKGAALPPRNSTPKADPPKPRPVKGPDVSDVEAVLKWLEDEGHAVEDGGEGRIMIDGNVMTLLPLIRFANDKRKRKGLPGWPVPEVDENRMAERQAGNGASSLAGAI